MRGTNVFDCQIDDGVRTVRLLLQKVRQSSQADTDSDHTVETEEESGPKLVVSLCEPIFY